MESPFLDYESEELYEEKKPTRWFSYAKEPYLRVLGEQSELRKNDWTFFIENPYLNKLNLNYIESKFNIELFQKFMAKSQMHDFYYFKPEISPKTNSFHINKLRYGQIAIFEKLRNLEKKLYTLENKLELKPLPLILSENQEFYNREKWLSEQKDQFPNEIIAYMKKNDIWVVIAHSKKENLLLENLETIFQNKELSEEDIIFFE